LSQPREQLRLDPLGSELAQGEQRLESGDAAADEQHLLVRACLRPVATHAAMMLIPAARAHP
jgi:hypothetical protein